MGEKKLLRMLCIALVLTVSDMWSCLFAFLLLGTTWLAILLLFLLTSGSISRVVCSALLIVGLWCIPFVVWRVELVGATASWEQERRAREKRKTTPVMTLTCSCCCFVSCALMYSSCWLLYCWLLCLSCTEFVLFVVGWVRCLLLMMRNETKVVHDRECGSRGERGWRGVVASKIEVHNRKRLLWA